jgi:hypothetical protein
MCSDLPWLQPSSTLRSIAWTRSGLALTLVVSDLHGCGLEGATMHSNRVLMLAVARTGAPQRGILSPQASAWDAVQLSHDGVRRFQQHLAFASQLPAPLPADTLLAVVADGAHPCLLLHTQQHPAALPNSAEFSALHAPAAQGWRRAHPAPALRAHAFGTAHADTTAATQLLSQRAARLLRGRSSVLAGCPEGRGCRSRWLAARPAARGLKCNFPRELHGRTVLSCRGRGADSVVWLQVCSVRTVRCGRC